MLRDYVDSRSPSPRLALSRLTPHAPLRTRERQRCTQQRIFIVAPPGPAPAAPPPASVQVGGGGERRDFVPPGGAVSQGSVPRLDWQEELELRRQLLL